MNSKTKIAISAIGIVMVLAIIGLTIGLVLVASQANVATNMTVSYRVSGVPCTITSSAKHYNTSKGLSGTFAPVEFTTTDASIVDNVATDVYTVTSGSEEQVVRSFKNVTLEAVQGTSGSMLTTVVYTFTVKNDATAGSTVQMDVAFTCAESKLTNVDVDYAATDADGAVADFASGSSVVLDAQETLTITITVVGGDATKDADFAGAVTIVADLHQTQQNG